ncbi:MAG: CAP domain-containing protein [Janthinobacterium lividum]
MIGRFGGHSNFSPPPAVGGEHCHRGGHGGHGGLQEGQGQGRAENKSGRGGGASDPDEISASDDSGSNEIGGSSASAATDTGSTTAGSTTTATSNAGAIDTAAPGSSASEAALLQAINKVRTDNGLNPLTNTDKLNQASAANDAINNSSGELGHHINIGDYGADGEITAMASNGISAQQAVDMWMNSPGHRAILMDPNQTEVGVSIDGNYATADFV